MNNTGYVSVGTFAKVLQGVRVIVLMVDTVDFILANGGNFVLAERETLFDGGRLGLEATGRQVVCNIDYVVRKSQGLAHGYVIVQFDVVEARISRGVVDVVLPVVQGATDLAALFTEFKADFAWAVDQCEVAYEQK